MRRLERTIRHWEASADAIRTKMLQRPTSRTDLLRALVYRFAPLLGDECPLDRIYVDANDRDFAHPLYTDRARDADYCAAELMRMTVGVSLLDWFEHLDWLRTEWPELFVAAWTRDAAAADELIGAEPKRLPMIKLRPYRAPPDAVRAVFGLFWELERLFELLYFLAGNGGVTRRRLVVALWSSSALSMEILTGTRAGRYLTTSWCHLFAQIGLFEEWWGAPHRAHPHYALGPSGNIGDWQDAAGTGSDYGHQVAQGAVMLSAPFQHDSRTLPRPADPFAIYFAGRDARSLAVHFLLELRSELGPMNGRRELPARLFAPDTDSAIGRLATLITASCCPSVGRATFENAAGATKDNVDVGLSCGDAPLGALVANPARWEELLVQGVGSQDDEPEMSTIARYSWSLGEDFLAKTVASLREARKTHDPLSVADALATARFSFSAWFNREAEELAIQAAWHAVARREAAHAERFLSAYPKLFQPIDPETAKFCIGVAATLVPSTVDMLVDPAFRHLPKIRMLLADESRKHWHYSKIRAEIDRRIQQRRKKWRP